MAPIMEQIKKVLDDIRAEDGYAMIFDAAIRTRDRRRGQESRHHGSSALRATAKPAPATDAGAQAGRAGAAPAGVTPPPRLSR